MNRRELLTLGLVAPLVRAGNHVARNFSPADARWRTFEITTRVDIQGPEGPARAWIPLPSTAGLSYQKDVRATWTGSSKARIDEAARGTQALVADWGASERVRVVEVTAVVSTRDRRVDLSKPSATPSRFPGQRFLSPASLIPVDGIVKDTAATITAGRTTDLARARAIYDWMVDNTLRDPTVRGCGLGDIRWMLETKTFAGKCADLNALYVGLARAARLPARDVYGLRVAPSAEFTSLGRSGGNVTTAQHCRAEVFVPAFGWIPVDPADVAKVRLEERSNGSLDDPYLQRVRERLFGGWEMNWIAYNDAHDVMLPGSKGRPLPFFMYPQAEINGTRLDSLEPDRFRYGITAREV